MLRTAVILRGWTRRLSHAARRGSIATALLLGAALQPATGLAAPVELLMVTDDGGSRLTLLDGRRFEPLHRIVLQSPLAGQPAFSPTGRFVYFGSRDGWLTKYDLEKLEPVRRVRAGAELRDIAVSADGRWVLAGNATPQTLALFDDALELVRTYRATTLSGGNASAVSAIHDAASRRSFVVSFDSLPQLWEVSYDEAAEPIFDGLVHDYRMGEAIATPGFLGVRRTLLDAPLTVAGFDRAWRHVLAVARASEAADAAALQVVNLDVRRPIAAIPLAQAPSPHQVSAFARGGRALLAVGQGDGLAIVDTAGWRVLQKVVTGQPSLFVGTHAATRHLWVGAAAGPGRGATIALIDKLTLGTAAVIDVGSRSLVSIDFSRDGGRAFVGLREPDSVAVFDTETAAEVSRFPALGAARVRP